MNNKIPDFEVINELGKGSYAIVQLCRNNTNKKLYALKSFSKSMLKRKKEYIEKDGKMYTETQLNKIYKEIAIMKKVHHKNCVCLYEVIDEESSDMLYLVIEYMKNGQIMNYNGKDHRYYNNKENVYDENTVREYFVDICCGLSYLHKNGIVHCDIKPENILLTDDYHCKISDFGVSQIVSDEERNNSRRGVLTSFSGTIQFCAPETFDCETFSGFLADVFALGVTLYILLCGNLPFWSENMNELVDLICDSEPNYPDYLSNDVIDLLKQMLTKDPNKRPSLSKVMSHKWLCDYQENFRKSWDKIEVTEEDIANAITRNQSVLGLSKIKLKIDKKIENIREKKSKKSNEINIINENKKSIIDGIDESVNISIPFEIEGPIEFKGIMKKYCKKSCFCCKWKKRYITFNSNGLIYRKEKKVSQTIFLTNSIKNVLNDKNSYYINIETTLKELKFKSKSLDDVNKFLYVWKKINENRVIKY